VAGGRDVWGWPRWAAAKAGGGHGGLGWRRWAAVVGADGDGRRGGQRRWTATQMGYAGRVMGSVGPSSFLFF